jgi:XTP/dITP diphosphohydrolase
MAVPLLIATTNPGKVREIQHELDVAGLHDQFLVRTLRDLPGEAPDCVEDRPTFIGNASRKARHFANLANCLTLADDSGLAVDALGGAPGVLSARYSGATGDRHTIDAANNARLLREMDGVPDDQRSARFVCAMALATPHADLAVMVDDVHGVLLREPRGDGGFGYDPLFYFPRFNKTTAELSAAEKGQISHRGKALRRMIAWMIENQKTLTA